MKQHAHTQKNPCTSLHLIKYRKKLIICGGGRVVRLCIEYWQVYAKLGIGSEYEPIVILMMRRIFGIHPSQVTMNEKKVRKKLR